MANLKVGDRVIALTSPGNTDCQPRIRGEIYTVEAVCYCPKCGRQAVNVGFPQQGNSGTIVCSCRFIHDAYGLSWTRSDHFAKVEDLEKEIAKAVYVEDYEFAQLLHNRKSHLI